MDGISESIRVRGVDSFYNWKKLAGIFGKEFVREPLITLRYK